MFQAKDTTFFGSEVLKFPIFPVIYHLFINIYIFELYMHLERDKYF